MKLIGFAIYVGIGAMLHAGVVGSTFDWSSAWTFAWLFAWPIMLLLTFVWFGVLVAIGCGMIWVAWSWLDMYANWRVKRRKATEPRP